MMFPLAIDPVIFSIGSLSVRWYGLILGLGALVGLYLAIREGKRFGISQEFLWICCYWVCLRQLSGHEFIM